MTPPSQASIIVFLLFFPFVVGEYGFRFLATIRWSIRVRNPNIEYRRVAFLPKVANADVAAKRWCWLSAVRTLSASRVPTSVDKWFVGDSGFCQGLGVQLLPFGSCVIVAQRDQPSFFARHCVLHREFRAAAVASMWEKEGVEAVSEAKIVGKFFA